MINRAIVQTLAMIAIMIRKQRGALILANIHERAEYARIVDRINGEEIDRNAYVKTES